MRVPGRADAVVDAAREAGVHLRLVDDDTVGVSTSETTPGEHLSAVLAAFGVERGRPGRRDAGPARLPAGLVRTSEFLTHEVFYAPPVRDVDAALPAPAARPATTRWTAA